jgi:hypothetical protein
MMHRIDHPQYHPITFKRDPKAEKSLQLRELPVYKNGARVRATSNTRPEKR